MEARCFLFLAYFSGWVGWGVKGQESRLLYRDLVRDGLYFITVSKTNNVETVPCHHIIQSYFISTTLRQHNLRSLSHTITHSLTQPQLLHFHAQHTHT